MTDFVMRLIGKDETKAATDSAAGNLSSLDGVAGKVKDTLTGLAAGLTVGAFAGMIKGSIDAGVKLTELSSRVGVGVAALSQYKYVAEANSISLDTLTGAFQKMQVNLSKSQSGTGAAADALDQLGLSTNALLQLAPDQQFETIAEALSQVGNKSEQARLSMALFGKAGGQLLPIMEEGRAGLQGMREEADRLGLTISETAGQQLAAFDDQLDKLGGMADGLKNQMALALLPALTDITKAFEDTGLQTDSFTVVMEGVGGVLKAVAFAGVSVVEGIALVGKTLGAIAAEAVAIASGDFSAAAQIAAENASDEDRTIAKLTDTYHKLFDAKKEAAQPVANQAPVGPTAAPDGGDATAKALAQQRKLNEEKLKADQEYLEGQAALELQKFQKEEELSQARIERAQGEAQRIFESTRTPMEQFQADYENLYELYQKGYFDRLGGEETFLRYAQELNNQRLESEKRTLTTAQKWERMTLQERAKFSFSTFADVFQAFSGNSKKMFEVSKALSIVQTTMNTYEAAVGAYKALAGIPVVGPALGAAAAAAAIGFGMAQVSAIKGQSFGGGNGVSAVSIPSVPSGSSGNYSSPTDYTGTGQGGQAAQPPKTIYINIEGGDKAQLTGAQVRTLIEAINEEIKTGNMRIQS